MGLLDAIKDEQFRRDVKDNALDLLLGLSRGVGQNATAFVDLAAFPFQVLKVKGTETPVGSTKWAEEKGLLPRQRSKIAGLLGEGFGGAAPTVLAAKAPQMARGLLQMEANAAAPRTFRGPGADQAGAIVWHGSPHRFDRFDASKIGTGEGAQAYGHGLYLAESPDVAKTYQALDPVALASPVRTFKGAELNAGTPEYHAATLLDNMGLQQARKTVSGWLSNVDPRMAREAEGWRRTLEVLNEAGSKADFKRLKNTGSLYKVDLPDSAIARMLDWDKPLSQQAPEVQPVLREMLAKAKKSFGGIDVNGNPIAGQVHHLYGLHRGGNASTVAEELRQAGIPGIRYLDGGSRGAGAGTSNFVVFPGEEGLLRIIERNGVAP